MTVTVISPRTHPAAVRRRPQPDQPAGRTPGAGSGPPTLTITFDIPLAGQSLTPQAFRLLEQVRELVERGDGTVTASAGGITPVPAERSLLALAAGAAGPEPARPTLRILTASRRVLRDGTALALTRLEFDLLRFLAQHPRRVFTRLQLLSQVWGYEHALVRTVDVHVRRLRAKVGDALPVVTTVYGVGYRLADGVRVVVEPDN
jgi:hypothetical protein